MDFKENKSQLIWYQTEDGQTKLEVRLEGETLWLTQAAMAELFQTTPQNITLHVREIYTEGELIEKSTCKENLQVQNEGARQAKRARKFYSLPVIVAIGFRVRSHRGTQFRAWATERLNEYLVKGFTMDDDRLKQGVNIGSDYFDEILEKRGEKKGTFYVLSPKVACKIRDIKGQYGTLLRDRFAATAVQDIVSKEK